MPECDDLKEFTPEEISQFADDLIQEGNALPEEDDFIEVPPEEISSNSIRSELASIAFVRTRYGKLPRGRMLTAKLKALETLLKPYVEAADPSEKGYTVDLSTLSQAELKAAEELLKILEKPKE